MRFLIRRIVTEWRDPIARGGLFLVLNTILTGTLGIGYWVVAARLFSPSAVGKAGALISASGVISGFGQLNLSGMLMRFLPVAGARSRRLVKLSYVSACASSLLLTIIAMVVVRVAAGPNSALNLPLWAAILFALAVLTNVVFVLEDAVLIGVRKTLWVPVENGLYGVAKIGLLVGLVAFGGWGAIFASWMIPMAVTLPLITWLLFGWLLPKTGAVELGPVRPETRRRILRFAIGDAVGGVSSQATGLLLPVIVAACLGPRQNALFYVAYLFASTLDQTAVNFGAPLVVEGARDPGAMPPLLRATLRRTMVVLIPAVAVLVFLASTVMGIYGRSYTHGDTALVLLALGCLPRAVIAIFYSVCRVQQRTTLSGAMQTVYAAVIVTGTLLLAHRGLDTVAWLTLATAIVWAAPVSFLMLLPGKRRVNPRKTSRTEDVVYPGIVSEPIGGSPGLSSELLSAHSDPLDPAADS